MVSVKQDKYQKSFVNCLSNAQVFERQIGNYFYSHGFGVRLMSDSVPFISPPNKTKRRLWDMELIDPIKKRLFYLEIKDFARCLYYDATGLSKDYVDGRLSLCEGGKKIIILLRDNMDIVNGLSKIKKTTPEHILDEMRSKGLVVDTSKGIEFVPYGNTLHTIMRDCNRDKKAEERVLSHFKGKDNPMPQYMWKLSSLMTLPVLTKFVIENPHYPYDET